jgi:hypothetical protein
MRFCLTLYHLQADAADPPRQRQNGMSILRQRTLCVAQIGWRFCSWLVAMLRPRLPKQSIAAKTEAAGIRSESSSLYRAERSYRPPPPSPATVRACSSRYGRGSSGLAAAGCDCFPALFATSHAGAPQPPPRWSLVEDERAGALIFLMQTKILYVKNLHNLRKFAL